MSQRPILLGAFGASLLIHLGLLPMIASIVHTKRDHFVPMPVQLVDITPAQDLSKPEISPLPAPKTKPRKIIAPRLMSKPTIFETPPTSPIGNTRQKTEPEKLIEETVKLAGLPETPGAIKGGWNVGNKSAEAEGGAPGSGNPFNKGDVAVVGNSGVDGGGGGHGVTGLGRGAKGDGTGGGGAGISGTLTGLARPLGGYQVKPPYPESARRAGMQGTTLLKLLVLENGRVGEVVIDQSAGHRDLDSAAVEAVKKWLFEPARTGKQAVAVWVLLPVKFELQ